MPNSNEIVESINKALSSVLKKETNVTTEIDLIEDGILDSLDSAMFLFEIQKIFNITVPDVDIEEQGFFKVSKLTEYINQKSDN